MKVQSFIQETLNLIQARSEQYSTNYGRLTDIGEAGVLALLSDSADAENADSISQ